MFKRFLKKDDGGIFEYVILLAAMSVAAILVVPQIKDFQVNVFNDSIVAIKEALTGKGEVKEDINFNVPNSPQPSAVIEYKIVVNLDIPTPRNDYQVMVVLDKNNFDYSKARRDGSDLIFKDMKGNYLDRYIESWNPNGSSVIWVKIPLAGTDKFTFSYDKTRSINNSPEKVFDLYDGFSKFDETKWTKSEAVKEGEVYAVNGVLHVNNGAISTEELNFIPKEGYLIEVKAKIKKDHLGNSGVFAGLSSNQFVTSGNKTNRSATVLLMRPRSVYEQRLGAWIGNGDSTSDKDYLYNDYYMADVIEDNKWYIVSYKVLPNKVVVYLDNQLIEQFPVNWMKDMKHIILGDYTGKVRNEAFKSDEMEYDYLVVRKASNVEPVATIGKEIKE